MLFQMRRITIIVLLCTVVAICAKRHHKKDDNLKSFYFKHGELAKHYNKGQAKTAWKNHKPVDQSADTVYKKEWKKMTHYNKEKKKTAASCALLNCHRHQVCFMDEIANKAYCVHKNKLKKNIRRQTKWAKKSTHDVSKLHKSHPVKKVFTHDIVKKTYSPLHKLQAVAKLPKHELEHAIAKKRIKIPESPFARKKIKQLKDRASAFVSKYHRTIVHEKPFSNHIKTAFDYLSGKNKHNNTNSHHKRPAPVHEKDAHPNSIMAKQEQKVCSEREVDAMGRRLLDWFQLMMEDEEAHHVQKHTARINNLRGSGNCHCQVPVGWQFGKLDTDHSSRLSQSELQEIEDNGAEHCVKPFLDKCDRNKDTLLSPEEWCCCFATVAPPCYAALKRVPTYLVGGMPRFVPGSYVPQCDDDGFYSPTQCHGSTGQCWCTSKAGRPLTQKILGNPKCGMSQRSSRSRGIRKLN